MNCTSCGCGNIFIIDSRDRVANERRRRYKCNNCGGRFTTIERIVERDVLRSMGSDSLAETVRLANLAKRFADQVKGE